MRTVGTVVLMAALIGLLALSAAAQTVTIEELQAKYPPNVDAMNPGFHWAPEFSREIVTPDRTRVALRTDWPDVAGLDRSAVTFGVPFHDGALASSENARLVTADGTPVPADLSTTATWWRKDGPVRWMLVSATLERDEDYFIEYGTAVEPFAADGLMVNETADAISVDTGPLQATISKTTPTVLDAVTVNGQAIVTPELAAANLPTVVDGNGAAYTASPNNLQVSFFRNGRMETVIRREGWYLSPAGEPFCQFITYTWFSAGSASVRHDHTLVVAFDSMENTIRDVRLALPVSGGVTSGTLAMDADAQPLDFAANALPARVVQTAVDACVVTDGAGNTTEGERAAGWAGGSNGTVGAFVSLRDFWEQYPMELEVTGDALIAHLYPAHDVPVLDYTPSVLMGDEYPGDRVYYRSFYRDGLDSWAQAYGSAKTHNLQFTFFAAPAERPAAEASARAFDEPVLAFADPEYATDTWAFGRVRHRDPEQFPELEALQDAFTHRKYWLRDRLGNYGWINFGDVNYNISNATNPEEINYSHWRHWAQMFYGGPNTHPLQFMRSGDRRSWDFHRVNTRHILDFDIAHLDHEAGENFRYPKETGGRYGGSGGICHYAAEMYTIGCDCHTRFMLWDYYLNGTPRTWEVFNEFVNHYAGLRDQGYNQVYRHRMTGGSLRLFAEAYEATWEPEYLSCAHQFADILYKAQEELGVTRYDDVYMNEGKVKYYQMTGDERMRDLFVNDMKVLSARRDANVFTDTRATTIWGLTHGYWFTGDRDMLPYALWQFGVATSRTPVEGEAHEIGAVGWTFEHAYQSTLGNQLPTLAALLAETDDLPDADAMPLLSIGPPASGNGPIYFQEAEDGDLSLKVEVRLAIAPPGFGAAPFSNWQQWAQSLPVEDRPTLVLYAPDGTEAARFDLVGEPEQGNALWLNTDGNRPVVQIMIPRDGQTGTYVLAPANYNVPITLQVTEDVVVPHVNGTGDAWVSGVMHHFRVPAGTEDFSIDIKALTLRKGVSVAVRDTEGDVVAEADWDVSAECRHDWERIEMNAGAPAEDETWLLTFVAPTPALLRFEGVPPFVASSPDALFVPERVVEMPAIEEPQGGAPSRVASPLTGGGEALALPSGVGVAFATADDTPLMNETEGTIEMWVRDTRQHSDLHNRTLVRSGDLSIRRRICIGTYMYVGSAGHQTGMVLPQGRWVHLAATWRPSTVSAGQTEVALYLDGTRVETSYNRHLGFEAGWAGTELLIPGDNAGLYVDELRVSDVARYEGNFDRPEAPFEPDANTLILSHFDDDTALVKGTQVQWETR